MYLATRRLGAEGKPSIEPVTWLDYTRPRAHIALPRRTISQSIEMLMVHANVIAVGQLQEPIS